MKVLKYIIGVGVLVLWVGCTTKADTYYNRQFRMIPTMYNVLYNGNLALEEGKKEISEKYLENYFEILPVEAETLSEEYLSKGEGNPHFDRAEEKAIKAIQRHSMVFDGKQKNRKIDDAYMLLGKARYYNGRYIPALEAFNHLLTNYGETNQRYNATVWREKALIQLGREEMAITDLEKILLEENPKRKERAGLHAVLAQAFINLKAYPKAIDALKNASSETRKKSLRGRYYFIIGQLFERQNQRDSAQVYYQKTIKQNWNIPRRLWVEAQIGKARTQTLSPEEKVTYLEKLYKMEKLYEHKNLLDLIYFQHALYLENEKKNKGAIDYYHRSLDKNKGNEELKKRSHQHLAELYFKEKNYPLSYTHYDSTLVYTPKKTLEYIYIRRKKDNLAQITAYEGTIQKADSILGIVAMPEEQRMAFFQKYVDSINKLSEKKTVKITNFGKKSQKQVEKPQEGFYFYAPQTVAYGKQFFTRQYGDRPLTDNWRWSSVVTAQFSSNTEVDTTHIQKLSPEEFISKLPSKEQQEQLSKERERALYQVGELYWEKFKEGKLAQERLNRLLSLTKDDELIQKALYQLYTIGDGMNNSQSYKERLLASYPQSDYAKILQGEVTTNEKELQEQYDSLQELLAQQNYKQVLDYIQQHKALYKRSPQAPDWEILKAKAIARLDGKLPYIQELEHIVKEYPNTKQAELIQKDLKILKEEKPSFEPDQKASSWKIVIESYSTEDVDNLKKYLEENGLAYITLSEDVYDGQEKWLVLHGFVTNQMANTFIEHLKENQQEKKEKDKQKNNKNSFIIQKYFVISSENYTIIQVYKNKEEYKNN